MVETRIHLMGMKLNAESPVLQS